MAHDPKAKRILVINGPNLNLLGLRQPEIYGHETMDDVLARMRRELPGVEVEYFQSNHEGALIDRLHSAWLHPVAYAGVVLNAGAYTHTSLALADALASIQLPVVEIHISDIYSREEIRRHSFLTPHCMAAVVGEGTDGYIHAAKILLGRAGA